MDGQGIGLAALCLVVAGILAFLTYLLKIHLDRVAWVGEWRRKWAEVPDA